MSGTDKLDATDRMILVRVKIERAKKHLGDLAAKILALSHTTIIARDANGGAPPSHFKRVPTLSFDVVAIAGDVVHNLRSALDHLAMQLAIVGSTESGRPLTEKEIRQIEFPIAETDAKYESDKARKVKGMRPEAVKALDMLKPYKGGNDPLWRIHELDNIDKHRALFTTAHDFLFTSDWLDGGYLLKTDKPNFTGVESEVEKNIQAEIEEAVSQTQVAQTNALPPSLHQLVDFVENLVRSFEPMLE
jgi:hypothetical protein